MSSRDEERVRLMAALETLEAILEDRTLLAALDDEARKRLMMAAGRVGLPERGEVRKLRKELRKKRRNEALLADEAVLAETGIRELRRAPVLGAALPPGTPRPPRHVEEEPPRELQGDRKCYVCKTAYREIHHFYDQLCPKCAALNWERRHRSCDLSGRVALVTGARVKIGYYAGLKLLRAGARVIVTTRFPRDAAARYAREPDFESFADRLEIFGLDLRHTPSVEAFAAHVARTLPRLDFMIHNACQTVRRPAGFYRHLMQAEHEGTAPAAQRALLASHEALSEQALSEQALSEQALSEQALSEQALSERSAALATPGTRGVTDSAALSQVPLLPEDQGADLHLFPAGQLDQDLQQVDLRGRNSWRLRLHEVPTVELLEVQLVNAIAPFVLNARLRALMASTPASDKHIVNVSAMEGQFYRTWKTDKHPHTNMAKAALNMMTRTSAGDYLSDGIHMNSVDTGWITDEDPVEIAARKVEEHGFHPPLDVVDGAARIVDPIFDGVITGTHRWGLFLKDYAPIPW